MSAQKLIAVRWQGDALTGLPIITDQRLIPEKIEELPLPDLESAREAIIALAVRGAPAIGITAAYALVRHLQGEGAKLNPGAPGTDLDDAVCHAYDRLATSRPTAVNLMWALDRLRACSDSHQAMLTARELIARLLMEARRIHNEDKELCDRIAKNGAALLPDEGGVLTVCNTGVLATGGVGTAIGMLTEAIDSGKKIQVYACETRPLLQGARLTATELHRGGYPVTLICDSMAAALMQSGKVQAVVAGADRITANGDAANKIGTYSLAVLAKHHGIPFYIAAPYSTFDTTLASGDAIPIEERNADEVRQPRGARFAIDEVPVWNPAFDVTPSSLIAAIVTERGVIEAPDTAKVTGMMGGDSTPTPAF